MFHNFVHSFKQPKLTRTLLAKWRAKSADKRPILDWVSGSGRADSIRDSFCLGYPSDDDEDSCDDVVAIIGMLRDHFAVSDDKLTRSQQLRLKEEAFNDARSTKMEEFTSTLRADSHGRIYSVPWKLLNYQCNLTTLLACKMHPKDFGS